LSPGEKCQNKTAWLKFSGFFSNKHFVSKGGKPLFHPSWDHVKKRRDAVLRSLSESKGLSRYWIHGKNPAGQRRASQIFGKGAEEN
jgi:hypothetical protein